MKKANLVLGVFMLLSCCVSAFCLSVMSYTLVTGELPFDLKPLMPAVESLNKDVQKEADEKVKKENLALRFEESHVLAIYRDLKGEQSKLTKREMALNDLEKRITAQKADVIAIQDRLRDEVTALREKLETIDQREITNVKELAATIAEIEPKQAGQLIVQMEKDWQNKTAKEKKDGNRLAPRVWYFMTTKERAAVEQALLSENNPITTQMVTDISDAMRALVPELKKDE